MPGNTTGNNWRKMNPMKFQYRNTLLLWLWSNAGTGWLGSCRVSTCVDIHDWHDLGQCVLPDITWARGLD